MAPQGAGASGGDDGGVGAAERAGVMSSMAQVLCMRMKLATR